MHKTLIVDWLNVCVVHRIKWKCILIHTHRIHSVRKERESEREKKFHTIAKTFALSNRHDCFFICLLACFYSCVFCPAAKSKNKSFDISHIVPEETQKKLTTDKNFKGTNDRTHSHTHTQIMRDSCSITLNLTFQTERIVERRRHTHTKICARIHAYIMPHSKILIASAITRMS